MPNWYKTEKGGEAARYQGIVSTRIFVQSLEDKDQERNNAYDLLSSVLNNTKNYNELGDVQFDIQSVDKHGSW